MSIHEQIITSLRREISASHILMTILVERAGGEIRITDAEIQQANVHRLAAYRDAASGTTIYRLLTAPDAPTVER